MKRNFIDAFVSFVSPQQGLKRVRARQVEELILRGYEGASRGRRTDGWVGGDNRGSAANLIAASADQLRSRSRDLVRNNPYGARFISVVTNNVVGYGIYAEPKSPKEETLKKLKDLWTKWAHTTDCDFDDRLDLFGLQTLVMRTIAESGSCLILKRYTQGKRSKIILQLQILEPDHLDRTKDSASVGDGGYIINGVEFSKDGKRVAYHIYNTHPGDIGLKGSLSLSSKRVVAEDVIHVFRSGRPGQIDDVPWLTSVMIRLNDIDKYQDAALLKQQISACFAAFIKDIDSNGSSKGNFSSKIEPGAIDELPAGRDISFANPPSTSGHSDFLRTELRAVAAGAQVTYEALTGDLENVNFSAGRLGFLEFQRSVYSWQWTMFIPLVCKGIEGWFLASAKVAESKLDLTSVEYEWTPPPREMIDPLKEMNANAVAVEHGFKTTTEVAREQGRDVEEIFREKKKEKELAETYGVTLSSKDSKSANKNDEELNGVEK